jgi:hypothetical protein
VSTGTYDTITLNMSRGTSSNLDYSKWDRMNFSDSEEEGSSDTDDRAHTTSGTGAGTGSKSNNDLCRVTRLDRPSRVTLSHGEVHVEETPSALATVTASTDVPSSTAKTIKTKTATTSAAETSSSPNKETPSTTTITTTLPASWTARGGFVEAYSLFWSQDRYTVQLRFQLPVIPAKATTRASGTRPFDCRVSGILPYEQRHSAVQSSHASLVITDNTTGSEWFRDDVAYPVYAAQDDNDDNDDGQVDWSIETWQDGMKYLVVTLYKATPVPDMTLWWRRPTQKCPEIELSSSASLNSSTSDKTNTNQNGSQFAAAWEEAHAKFRQGRQEQDRIEIDEDGRDDEA